MRDSKYTSVGTSGLSVQGEKGRATPYGAGGVGINGQEGGWAPL